MKRHWITTFVTFAALALMTGSLVAEESKDRPKRRPDGPKRMRRRPGGPRKTPDIGLTDAQKKEIEAIRKEAMAKIKDAKPDERKEIFAQMRKDIHGVFTEEQIKKLKELRQEQGQHDRPDLGLTDEQKKKMAAIRKEGMAKLKDAKPEERKAIMEGMRKQIEALLTPEQFKKFQQARHGQRRGGRPDIGLSDDQKSQIEAIRKKAQADAKDAKGEDRKAIFEKMKKDIHALLTEEQIEKLKKAHQGGRRPGDKGKGRGDRKGRRGAGDRKGRRPGGDKGGRKRPASE
ncbi:MAG: hypothetical protein QGG42_17610 [Phycisphaerae bacterium]|jgi:Spy/CpxP family protein refolding chaperone|nr:hypothetical protein [Phycisphaerae bacterium]